MSNKLKQTKEPVKDNSEQGKKTCFIIMPISDHERYAPGHFNRVYEHIIKPACELSGFKPIRADDVKTTNYIALDIIKQIIESDMAICDLSSQNPNVLYEVGIRQAFNLPVTFIKDICTKRIFDIQGFRDVAYDETLRIDTVEKAVIDLSDVITNTYINKNEVNSLVTLLGIEPAKASHTQISVDTELILNAIKGIEYRVSKTEQQHTSKYRPGIIFPEIGPIPENMKKLTREDYESLRPGQAFYHEKFGMGTIKSIRMSQSDHVAVVIFEYIGEKQLLLKFAQLWIAKEEPV